MKLSGRILKSGVRFFGCISAILGFSQISHAKAVHRPVHRVLHHAAFNKSVVRSHAVIHEIASRHALTRHTAVHHLLVRHTLVRHPERHAAIEHHVVYRRVASRRHDYRHGYIAHHALHHYVRHAAYLWCVPYARDVSHIDLKGDAFLWWAEAAGRYGRGERPQQGAVLNFRSSGRIPMGHVAVVQRVINSREILVTQANWEPDRVSNDVPVVDVSPNNNWSQVQVSIGGGRFGSTYPTYGFIYDQRPGGMLYASNGGNEVAEAPATHRIRLIAPNRTLR